MKKIINGKIYNTETAKEISTWDNGCNTNDFNHCWEGLYKTSKGQYFTYGYGGPKSKYSQSCGTNWWSGGEDIEPLSVKSAKEWLEEYGTADEYIAEFGEPEEA